MTLLTTLKSVRVSLTLWYSALLLVAFIIFGSATYLYLKDLLRDTLKHTLMAEVDWISRLIDIERTRFHRSGEVKKLTEEVEDQIDEHYRLTPRNYIVMLSALDKTVLYETENRGNKPLYEGTLRPGNTLIQSLDDEDYGTILVAARRIDPFTIQVAFPERLINDVLAHMLSILEILVPVVLLFSLFGGWLLAGIALKPIDQITTMANRITAQNLNERIPQRAVRDELGMLIDTINEMIGRLQSSFEHIRQFSMNVAHELRTPLTILKGESELALTKTLSREETQQLITTYLEETVRLSRIVDDLLTLAKADTGQLVLERKPLALNRLLEELYEDALVLSSEKHLTTTLERNDPAVVIGDALRLRQVFRNLVMNAVQYTKPGGSIRLTSQCLDRYVEVRIDDTGIGIPTDSLEKIFEPFYRVDSSRPDGRNASGLGLAIARWLVELHGGSIRVKSTVGTGSSFTVVLPRSSS
jgi:heavy metal sensor kinase